MIHDDMRSCHLVSWKTCMVDGLRNLELLDGQVEVETTL
jgi:hypothetical protein